MLMLSDTLPSSSLKLLKSQNEPAFAAKLEINLQSKEDFVFTLGCLTMCYAALYMPTMIRR